MEQIRTDGRWRGKKNHPDTFLSGLALDYEGGEGAEAVGGGAEDV